MSRKIKPWELYSKEIKEYCKLNGFSYEKLMTMAKQHNDEFMFFCYLDKNAMKYNEAYQSINDEERLPVILIFDYSNPENLRFEQTEHTRKYIGNTIRRK